MIQDALGHACDRKEHNAENNRKMAGTRESCSSNFRDSDITLFPEQQECHHQGEVEENQAGSGFTNKEKKHNADDEVGIEHPDVSLVLAVLHGFPSEVRSKNQLDFYQLRNLKCENAKANGSVAFVGAEKQIQQKQQTVSGNDKNQKEEDGMTGAARLDFFPREKLAEQSAQYDSQHCRKKRRHQSTDGRNMSCQKPEENADLIEHAGSLNGEAHVGIPVKVVAQHDCNFECGNAEQNQNDGFRNDRRERRQNGKEYFNAG